jgi:multiple sugar transport system substrate-binding protein
MVKKLIPVVLALVICTGLFFTSPVTGASVTIKMSNWLEVEAPTAGIFKKMIAEFEKRNQNIKVESVGIPFNQYKDQVLVMTSSGNAPDVIMGNSQMMVAFDGANVLGPLNGVVKREVINDIYKNNQTGTTFHGKLMALSWAPHPIAMFYNKDLFKQAGLDPEKPPQTWNAMIDAAKKIAALKKDKDGNQIYGLSLPDGKASHSGAVFNGIIYAFGGQFVDKKGNVVFDNKSTKEAFKFFKEMVDSGVMPAGVEIKDIRGLFSAGRVGIMFDGDFGRNNFRQISGKGTDFDKIMGVAIIPPYKTRKSETVYTEHELGIANDSKYKKEAAALVEFLLDKDAMIMYHQSNAILSARKSVSALPEFNEDSYMQVFNKQATTARPLPATNPLFDNAMLEVTKALERVTIAKEDIDTVVKETQEKIVAMYAAK